MGRTKARSESNPANNVVSILSASDQSQYYYRWLPKCIYSYTYDDYQSACKTIILIIYT